MKKIILTGGDGFIGGRIYDFLLANDELEVELIDKKYYEDSDWIPKLDQLVQSVDIILHVGANANTLNNDVNYVMYYNYYISKVLFDIASKHNKDVVYSSSAACEGVQGYPSNLYAWSKYCSEQYGLKNNKRFIALRYFNVYGPGEEHKKNMSSVAYQAFQEKEFMLFPNNPKRDFVYIDDVVSATTFSIFNNVESGIYHVGSGTSKTFEDVLDLMNVPYSYTDKSKIPDGYQFNTKADKNLFQPGWKPSFSLEKGIEKYKEYLK